MINLPQKIICVGLNYRDHAEEQGVALPERPLLFAKWPNTLLENGGAIRIPAKCATTSFRSSGRVGVSSSPIFRTRSGRSAIRGSLGGGRFEGRQLSVLSRLGTCLREAETQIPKL